MEFAICIKIIFWQIVDTMQTDFVVFLAAVCTVAMLTAFHGFVTLRAVFGCCSSSF